MNPETSTALEQLQKSIQTFEELALGAVHRDNLWRYSDAFMQSIRSILEDTDCSNEEKRKYFETTLEQYADAMKNLFDNIIGQAALIKSDGQFDTIVEVEKFNPYHDKAGLFSTANNYARFTVQTRDPSKQHWADAAIEREKERDRQGLVPGPKIKPGKLPNSKDDPKEPPKEAPKEKPAANHPAPEATKTKTNIPEKVLDTCRDVEAKTVSRKTEKMTLVDENGNIVLEKSGSRGSVRFGGYETAHMGPTVTLTHNHPGEFGGTFSGADVNILTKFDLRAIRAVGKEGTYSLERTSQTMGLKASTFNREYANQSNKATRSIKAEYKKLKDKVVNNEMSVDDANRQLAEHRTAQCNTLHNWLTQNASSYGYNYVFEPSTGGVGKMFYVEKKEVEEDEGEFVLDGEFMSGDNWMIKDSKD